jgi:hypothetical protein
MKPGAVAYNIQINSSPEGGETLAFIKRAKKEVATILPIIPVSNQFAFKYSDSKSEKGIVKMFIT